MDLIRKKILENYSDHIASSFSCVDILSVLYGVDSPYPPVLSEDDEFILSKGHAAPALYTILAMKGVLKWENLPKYGLHCDFRAPGVPFTTGSLGCGLGLGVGISLARRIQGTTGRVFVLIGDGELYEGSTWEAARFIWEHNLQEIIRPIVDFNSKSTYHTIPGGILNGYPLGYHYVADGHDKRAIRDNLISAYSMIVFKTVKGRGIDWLEHDPLCHVRKVISETA